MQGFFTADTKWCEGAVAFPKYRSYELKNATKLKE
jgi:hypothetical protein